MKDIDVYLKAMVERDASDLFISPNAKPTLKCQGVMQSIEDAPLTAEEANQLISALMTQEQQKEFKNTKESNFAYHHEQLGRFRISAYYLRGETAMVIRKIKSNIPSIKHLGLPEVLKPLVMQKRGLILLCGGTGMGKSTTMASMIHYRNMALPGHIISLEDPIEYLHQHEQSIVSQREIGIDTQSYTVALKNALRQAPDLINIGEIRGLDTIQHALSYAESGHLCLATFHATTAYQALDRLIQFYPEGMREQAWLSFSLNLRSILAQRLIVSQSSNKQVLAYELLVNAPHIAGCLKRGQVDNLCEFMARKNQFGMQTFDQSLFNLYNQGKISEQEAIAQSDSKNDLRLLIKLSKSEKGELGDSSPHTGAMSSGTLGLMDDL